MPMFRVYEVQEDNRLRKWLYEIEAADRDAALEVVQSGGGEPIDHGEYGDSDFGISGFHVVPDGEEEGTEWAEAASNIGELESV